MKKSLIFSRSFGVSKFRGTLAILKSKLVGANFFGDLGNFEEGLRW